MSSIICYLVCTFIYVCANHLHHLYLVYTLHLIAQVTCCIW